MAKVAANLLRKGIAGPLALYVSPDAKNSVQYTVYATEAKNVPPDRDYYLADDSQYVEARRAFEEYMVDMLTAFGIADAPAAARSILELETRLAEIHGMRVENRDPNATYNKLSRSEFVKLTNNFETLTYLDLLGLEDQSEFVVRQPSYVESLMP